MNNIVIYYFWSISNLYDYVNTYDFLAFVANTNSNFEFKEVNTEALDLIPYSSSAMLQPLMC